MITDEKLDELYASATRRNSFQRLDLIQLGFTAYDINKLTAEGVLLKTGRGTYEFLKEREVDNSIKKSVSKKKAKTEEVKKDSSKAESVQSTFLIHLKSHEYSEATLCFPAFYESLSDIDPDYKNAFLLLADYIAILPEEYRIEVNRLLHQRTEKFNEDEVTYYNLFLIVLRRNFVQAIFYLKKFNNEGNIIAEAFKKLLSDANKQKKRIMITIKGFLKNKDYANIVNFLETQKNSSIFSGILACALQLAYDYVSIEETGEINRDYIAIPNTYDNVLTRLIIDGKFVEAATYRANLLSLASLEGITDFIFLMLMDIINLKNRLLMNGESRKRKKED